MANAGSRTRDPTLKCLWAAACLGAATASSAWASDYAGSALCTTCHEKQAAAWHRSDHYRSMQDASPAAVAGDFSDTRVSFHDMATRFLREESGCYVETVGLSGETRTFPVRYTFGHRPLQQYLVDRGDGVLQAFDVAWDTRPAQDGGQRWYHLQTDEPIKPDHPFFWAGHAMNWSSHCADCHSTHVTKTFDEPAQRFRTEYAEVNVACEACHGPAREHVRLANAGALADSPHAGFERGRAERLAWRFAPGKAIAEAHGVPDDRDVDMCGGCHSLRTPLTPDTVGKPYHEAYRLELLTDVRYFPDGQIREEAFVLGSFLQSKMHVRGVTCGNCHEPHSGGLVAEGNAVCTQCHRPDIYDGPAHHRHPAGKPGSACVDCHMPARTYMGVDDRRDHSFPIPRPARSDDLGVPNACVDCHEGRDNQWAAARLRDWGVAMEPAHWSRTFRRLRIGDPGGLDEVKSVLADPQTSALVKASLLAQTANTGTWALPGLLQPRLADPDPLIRRGAVAATMGLPGAVRWPLLANRIQDDNPVVRFEVAIALSDVHREVPLSARQALQTLYAEHRRALAASEDLAASQGALARLEVLLGRTQDAERGFERALEIDPTFLPALVDLADLRRTQGREEEAGGLLRKALEVDPGSGAANVALGLHLVRLRRYEDALAPLAKAVDASDAEPRFVYIYAVAQHTLGRRDAALATLRQGIERWPWDFDLLTTLVLYLDKADSPEVRRHLDTLQTVAPDSPQVRTLRERYGANPTR